MAIRAQFTDAIFIVRVAQNGTRRTVGTSHSQAQADRSCCELARAPYNAGTGNEYVTERNAKYTFDDAMRVTGVR